MISRWIFGGVLVATLFAAFYAQHRTIVTLRTEIAIANGAVAALEEVQARDAANVNNLRQRVSTITKERAELARQMQGLNDAEILDFLSMPVPDGLRNVAEAYVNKRAPENSR